MVCRLAFVGNCNGRFDVWLTLILDSLACNNCYSWLRWSQSLSLVSRCPCDTNSWLLCLRCISCWFEFRLTEFCVSCLGAGTVCHGGSLRPRGFGTTFDLLLVLLLAAVVLVVLRLRLAFFWWSSFEARRIRGGSLTVRITVYIVCIVA